MELELAEKMFLISFERAKIAQWKQQIYNRQDLTEDQKDIILTDLHRIFLGLGNLFQDYSWQLKNLPLFTQILKEIKNYAVSKE